MYTHEVPTEQWPPFLEQFSRIHTGDRIDVEMVGGGAAPKSSLCDQPLRRILAITGDESRIDVEAGHGPDCRRISIPAPAHLSVTEREDGFPVALQIASDSGTVTSLRFEPADDHSHDGPPESFLG